MGEPCPTCRATYGVPVSVPDRCGRCLTGLSLDGRPVYPVPIGDGKWGSPITGQETLALPDGTWTIWSRYFFPNREDQIADVLARDAAGDRW